MCWLRRRLRCVTAETSEERHRAHRRDWKTTVLRRRFSLSNAKGGAMRASPLAARHAQSLLPTDETG